MSDLVRRNLKKIKEANAKEKAKLEADAKEKAKLEAESKKETE